MNTISTVIWQANVMRPKMETDEAIGLDALLDGNLLWVQAEDVRNMMEEALNATQPRMTAMGHDVSVSKKGYLELLRELAENVQKNATAIGCYYSAALFYRRQTSEVEVEILSFERCIRGGIGFVVRDCCAGRADRSLGVVFQYFE